MLDGKYTGTEVFRFALPKVLIPFFLWKTLQQFTVIANGSQLLPTFIYASYVIGGRDSSVGIATRYGLDGPGIESRCEGEARFSAPVQTGPGTHPASYTMGTGSLPGVKRPGRGIDHSPPFSDEVEGRVELYVCSPSGPSWPVVG